MSPPSWSTMTSARPRAGRWTRRVSRRHAAGGRVAAEQDHPRRLLRPQPAADVAGPGCLEARDRDLADLPAQVSRSTASTASPPGSTAAPARARRGCRPGRRRNPHRSPHRRSAPRSRRRPVPPAAAWQQGHLRSACSGAWAPEASWAPPSSSSPAQRQPSVSATRPKASTGPSQPSPCNAPEADWSAAHASKRPVNEELRPPGGDDNWKQANAVLLAGVKTDPRLRNAVARAGRRACSTEDVSTMASWPSKKARSLAKECIASSRWSRSRAAKTRLQPGHHRPLHPHAGHFPGARSHCR